MKITLALVTSVNGKLTRGAVTNIYEWTSEEDRRYFFSLIDTYPLIFMGRKTYEANKSVIRLVPEKLRIVLTRFPKRYLPDAVPHQLEFCAETPEVLVERLEKVGYKEALVVGGSDVASGFLQAKLVDTVNITLEPYLFGTGVHFLDHGDGDVPLQLMNYKQLNARGTLLLTYTVK